MDQKPNSRPSFFKILIGDEYTRRLLLPPCFVRTHRDTLPENAKLKTSSGATWYVKIEKTSGGKHWFTNGWSEFVKDANIEFGEFFVFRFDSVKSTFDVSAYGINGCEKEILGCNFWVKSELVDDVEWSKDQQVQIHSPVSVTNKQKMKNGAAMTESDSSCPHFELFLKVYLKSRVPLRKEFCEKAELMGKDAVILEYAPTQRFSIVCLDDRTKQYQAFRLELAMGWNDFRNENGLQYGRTYSFAFNRARNVIQVQPVNVRENVIKDNDDDEDQEWNEDQQVEIHGPLKDKKKGKNVAHFEIVLKEWQKPRLRLRKEFAEKAHLIGKEAVILEYAPTRQFSVVFLNDRSDQYHYRLELAMGWNVFCKQNGLKIGKTYSLTFNPAKNVIQVQPVNKK